MADLTTAETDTTARRLREALAAELERDGALRTTPWREAVRRVARHVFLPKFYIDEPDASGITGYAEVSPDSSPEEWLRLVYENRTWVTQLDYGAATSAQGTTTGTPTSSSTLPSTVVRMLEDLDVEDGHNVLEVGTGTGYSTALLCARLGDDRVVSVEYDADLSADDQRRLASLGYHPTLVVGDGALGYSARAPYQRIIATYSPDSVPPQWIDQADQGAVILVSLAGSLGAYGYVKLRTTAQHSALGRFMQSDVSFMPSRETHRPQIGPLMRAALAGRETAGDFDAGVETELLDHPAVLWALQLALPGTIRVRYAEPGRMGRWFLHADGSWAVFEAWDDGARRVRQGGPRPLGTLLEEAVAGWVAHGRPELDRYGLTVTPGENLVWLDKPDGPTWKL